MNLTGKPIGASRKILPECYQESCSRISVFRILETTLVGTWKSCQYSWQEMQYLASSCKMTAKFCKKVMSYQGSPGLRSLLSLQDIKRYFTRTSCKILQDLAKNLAKNLTKKLVSVKHAVPGAVNILPRINKIQTRPQVYDSRNCQRSFVK